MLRGIGVDLVNIESLRATLEADARAAARMFTPEERAYCAGQANPLRHLAGTAAVKEAVMKALGSGWTDEVDWLHIEVHRREDGGPEVRVSDGAATRMAALGATRSFATISHDGLYAVAVAVLEA